MQILDNFLILAIHILCFIAGIKLADKYHAQAKTDLKNALERQFLRLKTHSDADDPCRPYKFASVPVFNQGDLDGDERLSPIPPEFMENLHNDGFAKTSFKKSDLTK
jgi:hypothetical protein